MNSNYYIVALLILLIILGFYFMRKPKKLTDIDKYRIKIEKAKLNKELYLNASLSEREDLFYYYTFKISDKFPIDEMSIPLRIFYLINILEMEVNNGGLLQFMTNSSGIYAKETVESLELIGANNFGKILREAIDIIIKYEENHNTLNRKLDKFKHLQIITNKDIAYNEKMSSELNKLDSMFYDYPDDLTELKWKFIEKNIDSLWNEIQVKYGS